VASGITGFMRAAQMGRIKWLGSPRLAFWKSRWGERLFRLAGVGLKAPPPVTALPQHTEVALGRALDAIFEALPRPVRRDLKEVPETARRLERDAQSLRESLDALDAATSAADRAGKAADAAELAKERERVAERLASTVTALETIRLGLLRLQ